MQHQEDADRKLEVLKMLIVRMSQENDALWARFNYLSAVQLALLAAFGLSWRTFNEFPNAVWGMLIISVVGFTLSVISIRTVSRLRSWQKYWANRTREVDVDLSTEYGFPQLFPAAEIKIKPGTALTGPVAILAIFVVIWLAFVIYLVWMMLVNDLK